MTNDGLLNIPYTEQDWLVASIAIIGTLFKIILLYENPDERNPTFRDYISMIFLSYITTIGLYEYALFKEVPISKFYIPFSIVIILSKDLADWMFNSEDGRKYVINTFKLIINKLINK